MKKILFAGLLFSAFASTFAASAAQPTPASCAGDSDERMVSEPCDLVTMVVDPQTGRMGVFPGTVDELETRNHESWLKFTAGAYAGLAVVVPNAGVKVGLRTAEGVVEVGLEAGAWLADGFMATYGAYANIQPLAWMNGSPGWKKIYVRGAYYWTNMGGIRTEVGVGMRDIGNGFWNGSDPSVPFTIFGEVSIIDVIKGNTCSGCDSLENQKGWIPIPVFRVGIMW